MKKRIFLLALLCGALTNCCPVFADTGNYQGLLPDLKQSINGNESFRNFNQTGNITLDGSLNSQNTAGSTYTYNGGSYGLNGANFTGLSSDMGQTLNIINAGSLDSSGNPVNSINGFSKSGWFGAAVYSSGNANISNSVFTNNTNMDSSYGSGAAVMLYNNGQNVINVANSTFVNNNSYFGGALAVYAKAMNGMDNSSIVNISNSLFKNNSSQSYGGAIYSYGYSGYIELNINNTRFIGNVNNVANGGGAAIYARATNSTVTNSYFSGNNAIKGFGTVFEYGGYAYIANSTFDTNYAKFGAAIAEREGRTDIYNSTFKNNQSTSWGGALLNRNGNLNVYNSTIDNNSAVNAGGAIYNAGPATTKIVNTTISNNSSLIGGGIYNTAGTVDVSNSTFTLNKATGDAGGALSNLAGSLATINNSSFTSNTAATSGGAIYNTNSSVLNISNSSFSSNTAANGGAVFNESGTVNITNSTFYNNQTTSGNGNAIYNKALLNIVANSGNTVFSGNTSSYSPSGIYLESGTMNLNAGNGGAIVINDKIDSLNLTNPININKTGTTLDITGPSVGSPTSGTVAFNNSVNNSTVNLYSGTLSLGNESNLNTSNLSLYGGTLNLINNSIGTMQVKNLAINSNTNLGIDVDLANKAADKITSTNPLSGSVTLILNNIHLLSDSGSRNTNILIADNNTRNYIQLGSSNAETPLYKYNIAYNSSSGHMSFVNQGFSPSVLSTPVGAQTGTVLTQASMYHEAFSNIDAFMLIPQTERLLMKYNNKYASSVDNFVFSPTLLPEEDAGTWVKQFTNFENIPLRNGPNVSNVGYGMLVGRDSELKELGHGFDGYVTAYVGYNGSHQNYDSVGIYQNGGLLGLTGTVYKGNFFASLTANAGANAGNAYTSYGTDNFTTLVAGVAAKTGYNFEFFNGKFILQPAYMMSYTFADTLNYTAASGVDVKSDPINAIQISPGVKFIFNLENGWQPYLGVNMVWNIMDTTRVYANDVQLPQMSVLPYVEYGVGLQRKWNQRFTGFIQAMARGGGRNGVALQLGFRWSIGKEPYKTNNSNVS